MRQVSLNAEGLTDEDVYLVQTFADSIRAARRRGIATRKSFRHLWTAWKRTALPIGEAEVERIVGAAVAEVRGRR